MRQENAEDCALIIAMTNLVDLSNWKGYHGQFKVDAYTKLESFMKQKLFGCGMKSKLHIKSRVKLLRNQYNAIVEMLGSSASGFAQNNEEKLMTCLKLV